MVTIENFQALGLKIGKIITAEKIPNSDKLLKLSVDLGQEKRQLVAGIGLTYSPEQLVNRLIVVVTNLVPRTLMGIESQGMLLAANENGPILLQPEQSVSAGTLVQ